VSKRLADVRAAPGPLAHARLGPLRASKFRERTGARFRPNGGVHVGLALARIQLIGEQAILKRGSPGAPRLTALGLDREAARRARQRVSAEIVALPLPCSSSSQGVAAAIGVIEQRKRPGWEAPDRTLREPRLLRLRASPTPLFLCGERDRFGSPAVIGLVESMTPPRLTIRRTRSAGRGDPASVAAPAMARPMNLALDRGLIMCGQGRTTATD
jgi:hypothetical protein